MRPITAAIGSSLVTIKQPRDVPVLWSRVSDGVLNACARANDTSNRVNARVREARLGCIGGQGPTLPLTQSLIDGVAKWRQHIGEISPGPKRFMNQQTSLLMRVMTAKKMTSRCPVYFAAVSVLLTGGARNTPAAENTGAAATPGFSFAVYGDSRTMMFLPYPPPRKPPR